MDNSLNSSVGWPMGCEVDDFRIARRQAKRCGGVVLDTAKLTRVATWNVNTLGDNDSRQRLELLARDLEFYNIDVACLSETRYLGTGNKQMKGEHSWFSLYFSGLGPDDRRERGVAIAVSNSAQGALVNVNPVNERLMSARFETKIGFMTVVACYAPTDCSTAEAKDSFYGHLEALINTIPKADYLVIAGDLNAEVGARREGWERVIGRFGRGNLNDNGVRLLSFANNRNMKVAGSYFRHKSAHSLTWYSNDGRTVKALDHILVRSRWFTSVHNVRVYRGTGLPSDHELVVANLQLHLKARKTHPKERKYDVEKLRLPEVRRRFSQVVGEKLNTINNVAPGMDDKWRHIKSSMQHAGKVALGYVKGRRAKALSDDTLRLAMEKRAAATEQQRKTITRTLRAGIRKDADTHWRAVAAEVESARNKGDARKFFSLIRDLVGGKAAVSETIMDKNGTIISDKSKRLERWKEYYADLLNKPPPVVPDVELVAAAERANAHPTINCSPPTALEIRSAIKALKNGKAAGPDGLPAEFYKAAEDELVPVLRDLFDVVWMGSKTPDEWQLSVLVPVFKKGDVRCCGNYRGISLLAIAGKILSMIVLKRIGGILDEQTSESQAGFRGGRGTMDQIFVLRQILERRGQFNRDTLVAFLDYSAAFDSVDRGALWGLLKISGIPAIFITLIKNCYNASKCRVRAYGELSEGFEVTTGVRQGDVLSPILFIRAVDWVMTKCTSGPGVTVGENVSIAHLEYADDLALLEETTHSLQVIVDEVKNRSEMIGLNLNPRKCKVLASRPLQQDVNISGVPMEVVDSFPYLGSRITTSGDSTCEITARIGKAGGAFKRLDRKVWRNHSLSLDTKLRVYEAVVLSTLLYGLETVPLKVKDTVRLEGFECSCLRRLLGISLLDLVSNKTVLKMAGYEKTIGEKIRFFRLKWLGHVARMPLGRMPRETLFARPPKEWRRRPGGQRLSWRKCVENDTREMLTVYRNARMSWENSILDLAADRVQWRSMIAQWT